MNHHNSDASCARVNEWCCLSLAVVAISQFESADPSTQISRKRVSNNITTTAKVSKICLHVCYTAFDCCNEFMTQKPNLMLTFIVLNVSRRYNWLKLRIAFTHIKHLCCDFKGLWSFKIFPITSKVLCIKLCTKQTVTATCLLHNNGICW